MIVLCFAVLGFLAVPLGEKTGFEHVRLFVQGPRAQMWSERMRAAAARLETLFIEPIGNLGAVPDENEDAERR